MWYSPELPYILAQLLHGSHCNAMGYVSLRGVQPGTRVPILNMELMIDNVVDVLC